MSLKLQGLTQNLSIVQDKKGAETVSRNLHNSTGVSLQLTPALSDSHNKTSFCQLGDRMADETVLITDELIEAGKSARGGWSREQLRLLGIPWPPPAGWKRKVLGARIRADSAEQFIRLRDRSGGQGSLF